MLGLGKGYRWHHLRAGAAKTIFESLDPNFPALFGMQRLVHSRRHGISLASSGQKYFEDLGHLLCFGTRTVLCKGSRWHHQRAGAAKTYFRECPIRNATSCPFEGPTITRLRQGISLASSESWSGQNYFRKS
jgi:hypothetical protein